MGLLIKPSPDKVPLGQQLNSGLQRRLQFDEQYCVVLISHNLVSSEVNAIRY